jgi:selenocysteine lyase/cysteine desulfurase
MTCTDLTPAALTASGAPRTIVPLLPVTGTGLESPLVAGGSVPYVNLDHAASTPALQSVVDHLLAALPYYSSVHRGAGFASQVSTDLYEAVRPAVRTFAGARPDDAVIVVRGTTEALNLLASAVPAGGRVAVLDIEHHANLLPWRDRDVVQVPSAVTLEATIDRLTTVLAGGDVTLLTVTGASNVTGDVLPLARLAALAHAHGARIAVDAAQLAPHRRLDVAGWDVDYLAFSGHKIYAPFGAGVLVGRADWLDAAPPHLAGGGAVTRVTDTSVDWATGPARHEAGSPNVLGAAALAQACRDLGALPPGALEEHDAALTLILRSGLAGVAGVSVLDLWHDSTDRVGVVTFRIDGLDAGLAAVALSDEHGVGVRDGRFCAHPLLDRLPGDGSALRASIGLSSSSEDVVRLLDAVRHLAGHGPRSEYTRRDGRWVATVDRRRSDPAALNPLALERVGDGGSAACDD